MRALFLHIITGLGAAVLFFTALFAFNTGGIAQMDALGLATLFALVAMFFLSMQLILARLSQDDERVRINSRDQRR